MSAASLRADMLLRPLPMPWLLPLAGVVLVAGAAYCLGYEGLSGGAGAWPGSLVWSACAVLPWLGVFELVKRAEWDRGRPVGAAPLAALLVATGALSIGLEMLVDALGGGRSAPLGLLLMRRLPAIAATLMLLLLARRERRSGEAAAPETADEAESLRGQAAAIRWIKAADNYLELHLDGRVRTMRMTMREAAAILEPLGFVRIHRSFLVNRAQVESVVRGGKGLTVRTRDGDRLPAGRAFGGNLRGLG
ncbi:MAG TPA: LytTR family DNA-binding domain-containing protein [Allosphingosinicella sp.]|jgi:hypothetical protein